MADLIPTLYDLMGNPPPRGQEFWDAAAVTKTSERGNAAGAAVLGGAVGAVAYSLAKPGRRSAEETRIIENAHRELGLSNAMVWAVNQSSLFVFKASDLTNKPKQITMRHPLKQVAFVAVGGGPPAKTRLDITIYDVPVGVIGKKAEVERFAQTLQQAIAQLL